MRYRVVKRCLDNIVETDGFKVEDVTIARLYMRCIVGFRDVIERTGPPDLEAQKNLDNVGRWARNVIQRKQVLL